MTNPHRAKTAEQIKVIVAGMLERRIKDPRLGFVTVTGVRLTGDGREATVFYTVLGDAGHGPNPPWRSPRRPACCARRWASSWG